MSPLPRLCWLPGLLLCCSLTGQQLPEDWGELDIDQRWARYRDDCASHSASAQRRARWVALLAAHGDFELLEWLGVYEGWDGAGPALVRAGAPQWMRVALWNLGDDGSVMRTGAEPSLLSHGGAVRGWMERFPVAQHGKGAELYRVLGGVTAAATDPGAALSPLDPHQVLLPLLQPRRDTESARQLRQRVARGLDGVVVWGQPGPGILGMVLRWTAARESLALRVLALQTVCHLPPDAIPTRAMAALAVDPERSDLDRAFAVAALAGSSHPRAYLTLVDIAGHPGHPGWQRAVARLGEFGLGHGRARLGELLDDEGLGLARRRTVERALDAHQSESGLDDPAALRQVVERLLWAEHAAHPRAARMRRWTETTLLDYLGPDGLLAALETLAVAPPRGPYSPPERAALVGLHRSWIEELRTEAGTFRPKDRAR